MPFDNAFHTVRAGINYHINSGYVPLKSRALPEQYEQAARPAFFMSGAGALLLGLQREHDVFAFLHS